MDIELTWVVVHSLTNLLRLNYLVAWNTLNISSCQGAEGVSRTLDKQFNLDSDEHRLSLLQCKASSGQACFTSFSPCRGVLNMPQQTISNISCLQTPQLFLHQLISFVSFSWKIVAVCHDTLEITYHSENISFSAFRGKPLKYLGYNGYGYVRRQVCYKEFKNYLWCKHICVEKVHENIN